MDNENKNLKSLQRSIRILGTIFLAISIPLAFIALYESNIDVTDADKKITLAVTTMSILLFASGILMFVVSSVFKDDSRKLKYSIFGGIVFLLVVSLFWVSLF